MPDLHFTLVQLFAQIPDHRNPSGRRYSLASVLSLAVAAMICGYKSYSAIAEWGRNYGERFALALGFKAGKTPCAATFFNIFSKLDCNLLEPILSRWAEQVLASNPDDDNCETLAIDGKSLRGSINQGAEAAHILSAFSHRLGITLFQVAVPDKTNEIGAVAKLLDQIVLTDRLITTDSMLTQRKVCEKIIKEGGDYCLPVKANQPTLLAQIEATIEAVEFHSQPPQRAQTIDCGHGRIEERKIISTPAMRDHGAWPGLEQVFKIERRVVEQQTGKQSSEEVYGITSLSQGRADADEILSIVRGHWGIENKSHWVRDVIYEEDRSQVRVGSVPQVMAALRNTAIGLIRAAGESGIASGGRRFAAQPAAALALIGVYITP